MSAHITYKKTQKAFTLVELLVVIAVLGVLAASVLVAINPLEQLARGRDAGRISAVAQLGHGVQAYATSHGGVPPPSGAMWQSSLQTSGEITSAYTMPAAGTNCSVNAQGNICYSVDPSNNILIWTFLESKSNENKPTPACATKTAAVVYDSSLGKAGVECIGAAGTTPTVGSTLY